MVTLLFAILASLLFEAPFISLEKLLLGREKRTGNQNGSREGIVNNGVVLDKAEEANTMSNV